MTQSITSTNEARSRSTFPCTADKPLPLRTAAGPGTSGKGGTERVFSFTLTSGRLGITAKGLHGVQRAPDQHAATHCLLGTEKNIREWGPRRQVLKGGALPNKSSTGAPRQAPRLSLSARAVWKDCYEGPSASFPTFTPSLICLSLERNLPVSPSLPSDLLIGCDRTNTPGTNKATCLSCLWIRAGLKYFANVPKTISRTFEISSRGRATHKAGFVIHYKP